MRIVVSGTHASGKSTLISDFALRHPLFTVLPDPFELIDEAWDSPSAAMFAQQLRVSAARLLAPDLGADVIAERGPLDFLAYLIALQDLSRAAISDELLERSRALAADALRVIDVLAVLPLTSAAIDVAEDEDLELRAAMDDVLLELVDDPDLIDAGVEIVELTGPPSRRLEALESIVEASRRDRTD